MTLPPPLPIQAPSHSSSSLNTAGKGEPQAKPHAETAVAKEILAPSIAAEEIQLGSFEGHHLSSLGEDRTRAASLVEQAALCALPRTDEVSSSNSLDAAPSLLFKVLQLHKLPGQHRSSIYKFFHALFESIGDLFKQLFSPQQARKAQIKRSLDLFGNNLTSLIQVVGKDPVKLVKLLDGVKKECKLIMKSKDATALNRLNRDIQEACEHQLLSLSVAFTGRPLTESGESLARHVQALLPVLAAFHESLGNDPLTYEQLAHTLARTIQESSKQRLLALSRAKDKGDCAERAKLAERDIQSMLPLLSALHSVAGIYSMQTLEEIDLKQTLLHPSGNETYVITLVEGGGEHALDGPCSSATISFEAVNRLEMDLVRIPARINGRVFDNLTHLATYLRVDLEIPEETCGAMMSLFAQNVRNSLSGILSLRKAEGDISRAALIANYSQESDLTYQKESGDFEFRSRIVSAHLKCDEGQLSGFAYYRDEDFSLQGVYQVSLLISGNLKVQQKSVDTLMAHAMTTIADLIPDANAQVFHPEMKGIETISNHMNLGILQERLLRLLKVKQSQFDRLSISSSTSPLQEECSRQLVALEAYRAKIEKFKDLTFEKMDQPEAKELLKWAQEQTGPLAAQHDK